MAEEVGNWCACLIVSHVEEWSVTAVSEFGVDFLEGSNDGVIGR